MDRFIHDGEEIRLGDTVLVAHLTPGHTKGCTTWTMVAEEGGRKYHVVFSCGARLNNDVPLIGNAKYPNIAEDYAKTFRVLKSRPCDIFLGAHGNWFRMTHKAKLLEQGASSNPFIDPAGYRAYVERLEDAYLERL